MVNRSITRNGTLLAEITKANDMFHHNKFVTVSEFCYTFHLTFLNISHCVASSPEIGYVH